MSRPAGSFQAADDRGRNYTLYLVPGQGLCGPGQEVKGTHDIRTADGLLVRRITKGEYQMEGSGLILRSADPDAP